MHVLLTLVAKKDSGASEAKTEQQTTVASKAEPSAEENAALEKAKVVSESFHSSKAKIKEYLVEQEKFPEEAAQYAVDNLK